MEHETMIDTGRDGLHCILFSNRDVLDQEEIEKIFSQYGDVATVKFHADNKRGICFVRYYDRDDAVRAVVNLRGDSCITLLEHTKKKQRNNGNLERRRGSDRGQENCDETRFFQQFDRQHNQGNDRSSNSRDGDYQENSNWKNSNNNIALGSKNTNGNQKQNNVPWGSNNANRNKKENDLPWGSNNANGNQKQSDQSLGSRSPNEYEKQNNVPYAHRSPKKQNGTLRGPYISTRYQESNTGLPDLVDANRSPLPQIQNQSIEVPELITASGKTLSATSPIKKQIFVAQEVIVANIHPEFGAAYILHLFDKYEPLAISNIMVESKTGKRYCHVYFKSAEQSQQVESSYDQKLLMDERLVVLRSNRLIDAAYFK